MKINVFPEWLSQLDEEDIHFIKNFILASGSLKDIAIQYGVSYPTVRLRLDRLIQRIQIYDRDEQDSYISLIKQLALKEKIDYDTAKILIQEYRKEHLS